LQMAVTHSWCFMIFNQRWATAATHWAGSFLVLMAAFME
jgi:hypothetical protein